MKKLIPIVVVIAVIAAIIGGAVIMQSKSVKPPAPTNTTVDKNVNKPTAEPKKNNNPQPTNTKSSKFVSIPLTILTPENGASFANAALTIKGKTLARADVIANETETIADTSGNFTANITLDEGDNIISITAIDADGNSSEKEMTVTYNPANY